MKKKIRIVGGREFVTKKEGKQIYMVYWTELYEAEGTFGVAAFTAFKRTKDEFDRCRDLCGKEIEAYCVHHGTYNDFDIL